MRLNQIIFIIILLSVAATAYSQNAYEFYSISQQTNKTGMYVLGTWALTNMAAGAYGWSRYDGSQKYFHQMNLMWNTVNMGIAVYAMYSFSKADPLAMTATEMLRDHLRKENLFLINAGLDVIYIGGGLYMRHLANRGHQRAEMLKGYGNSVILQGSFLLVFDLVMYVIQRNHRLSYHHIFSSLQIGPTTEGVGLAIGF